MQARAESSRVDLSPVGDDALLDAVRQDLAQHGLAGPDADRREQPHGDTNRTSSPARRDRNESLERPERVRPARPDRNGTRGTTRRRAHRLDPGGADAPRAFSARLSGGLRPAAGHRLSDATVARLGATLLWVLVIVAAYGGVTAWLRPGASASVDQGPAAPGDVVDGRWEAAGFAERYVAAYLAAGSEGAGLAPYLGYSPDLPSGAEAAEVVEPLRVVDVARGHDERAEYWSVTVAVGQPDLGQVEEEGSADGSGGDQGEGAETGDALRQAGEVFWQVGVDTSGNQPVAAGLPARVPGPPPPERVDLAVSLSGAPNDEPMVESVEGFLAAYLCGAADLDRYVHPDYVHPSYEVAAGDAARQAPAGDGDDLVPADPPVCGEVEVDRWADAPARDVAGTPPGDDDAERRTVVAEVVFDTGSDARRATQSLLLTERDGRWEVAALLPAPPIEER